MSDLAYGVTIFVLSGLGGMLGSWLGSYVKKKGENLATREDVAELTRITEGVKAQFETASARSAHERAVLLEAFKSKESLRTLAGERRLQALQEAFALWRELGVTPNDDTHKFREACEWWQENSLYLDPKPREAFANAINAWWARRLHFLHSEASPETAERVRAAGDRLREAGDVIVRAAGLPPLAGGEQGDEPAASELSLYARGVPVVLKDSRKENETNGIARDSSHST
jgi:hypothetical protein